MFCLIVLLLHTLYAHEKIFTELCQVDQYINHVVSGQLISAATRETGLFLLYANEIYKLTKVQLLLNVIANMFEI